MPHVVMRIRLAALLGACLLWGGCAADRAERPAGAGAAQAPPVPGEASAAGREPERPARVLWYRRPAEAWHEALPVGNGRLGAMVFGGVGTERLQLNDDTLYAGEPGPVGVVPIHRHVEEAFDLVRHGRYEEADRFVAAHMLGRNHQSYTTLGDLRLVMQHEGEAADYDRRLDLREAVVRVRYRAGGAVFTREVFASAPDDVLVVRLTCDRPGRIGFDAVLATPHAFARLTPCGPTAVALSAKAPMHACNRTIREIRQLGDTAKYPWLFDAEGRLTVPADEGDRVIYAPRADGPGMRFEARVRALTEGGRASADAGGLHVRGADAVTLLVAAATSFNGFRTSPSAAGADPSASCARALDRAAGRPFDRLRADHAADHRRLFDRVTLCLGPAATADLPTDERLGRFAETRDPDLAALVFQYGRYLLTASSRPGTQPANLQGLWCQDAHAAWNGGYTTNINAEMNYWPAEVAALGECHEPLIQLVRECAETGRQTAERAYGLRGWAMHHNVSIWRVTDPLDKQARFSFWPMAGGWLCRHVWDRYDFGRDRRYLAGTAYPLMKGAAEFYLDWLREGPDGRLVTPVATSPENQFRTPDGQRASVSMGSTMDLALVRDLFANTLRAAEILDADAGFRDRLRRTLDRLLPYQVGRHGQLQEWFRDWDDPDDHHRHLSHLYGVYPGESITPWDTPDLARAAARSLEMRGLGDVGFTRAWMVNLWARLGRADRALEALEQMVADGLSPNLLTQCWAGRPVPFDIDPNLGGPAGLAEMLLQSHGGSLRLLPALPADRWPDGWVRGLRARGGFVVDLRWAGGRLVEAGLAATVDGPCRVRADGPMRIRAGDGPLQTLAPAEGFVAFPVRAGTRYTLRPAGG